MRRISALAVAIPVCCVLLAACGSGELTAADRKRAAADAALVPSCTQVAGWKAEPQANEATTPKPVYEVTTAADSCFDEISFDIDTTGPVGYHVGYTDVPRSEGGDPIAVPLGSSYLQVTILAPEGVPNRLGDGQEISLQGDTERYASVQDVLYGGSEAQQTTFVVGLPADLPYSVSSERVGDKTALLVRIAHPAAVGAAP